MRKHLSYAAGFYTTSFEEFVLRASDIGVSGVQLIPDQSPNLFSEFDAGRLEKLRSLLEINRLEVSVHNVFYDINICSLVPEVKELAFRVTRMALEFCLAIGSPTLTIHPGYIYPGWKNDLAQNKRFWDGARVAIGELSRMCSELGVLPLLENGSYCLSSRTSPSRHEFHLGIEPVELARLVSFSEAPIGICADIGKLRASSVDFGGFWDLLGSKVMEVQVSSARDVNELLKISGESLLDKVHFVFEGRSGSELSDFLIA